MYLVYILFIFTGVKLSASNVKKDRTLTRTRQEIDVSIWHRNSKHKNRKTQLDIFPKTPDIFIKNNEDEEMARCKDMKFLVYHCITDCGGLADIQKGIVSTYLLSLISDRKFVIRMSTPCEFTNFYQPFSYDWLECSNYISTVPENGTQQLMMVNKEKEFRSYLMDINFAVNWTKQVVALTINWNVIDIVQSHFRKMPLRKDLLWINSTRPDVAIPKILGTVLWRHPSFDQDLGIFASEHIQEKSLVCAHIGTGDGSVSPYDISDGIANVNVTVVIKFLDRYRNDTKYVIHISTDSKLFSNQLFSLFRNAVSFNKTMISIDKLYVKRTDTCDSLYNVILEQTILTQCSVLLITNGEFGKIAAYIRNSDKDLFVYHTTDNLIKPVSKKDLIKTL